MCADTARATGYGGNLPFELGWHPCLTIDAPVLPASQVPSLVAADGRFVTLGSLMKRLCLGRVDAAETSYASVADLATALRQAAAAHGEHEKRIGHADANWPDWYAAYMVAVRAGTELPT